MIDYKIMAKTTKTDQELYACVKDEVSTNTQLMKLAQQVSFSQDKKSLILSFSPPIAASALAKALLRCES